MLSGHEPSVVATAFGASAALLWLGGELGAQARLRSGTISWCMAGASAGLVACGAWWPAHVMPAGGSWSASPGWDPLLAWLLVLVCAAAGMGAAAGARHNRLPASVSL